jgi:hypothetical protein
VECREAPAASTVAVVGAVGAKRPAEAVGVAGVTQEAAVGAVDTLPWLVPSPGGE